MTAALLATGCGAWGDGEKDDAPSAEADVGAGEVCHGLFAGEAEKALQATLGTEGFSRSTDGDGVKDAAEKLAGEPVAGGDSWRERRICGVYEQEASTIAGLTVTAERVVPAVADAPHTSPEVARYQLGRTAWANANRAVVYIDCISPRLAGAEEANPAVLAVSAWNRRFPQGDVAKYREANLALAYVASVALVKELGCKNNGGLADRLTVQEVPAG